MGLVVAPLLMGILRLMVVMMVGMGDSGVRAVEGLWWW